MFAGLPIGFHCILHDSGGRMSRFEPWTLGVKALAFASGPTPTLPPADFYALKKWLKKSTKLTGSPAHTVNKNVYYKIRH